MSVAICCRSVELGMSLLLEIVEGILWVGKRGSSGGVRFACQLEGGNRYSSPIQRTSLSNILHLIF